MTGGSRVCKVAPNAGLTQPYPMPVEINSGLQRDFLRHTQASCPPLFISDSSASCSSTSGEN
ncbi:MAG: hypothetical protein GPOALKHO_001127 [Sodalis sp.]|nr:MAG: hypothetical protein GPOALKHO_001127 [Sodalis sp.]